MGDGDDLFRAENSAPDNRRQDGRRLALLDQKFPHAMNCGWRDMLLYDCWIYATSALAARKALPDLRVSAGQTAASGA
ncbi:hypothetical protein [Allomesorhizobium alhagi]|uniref:hypothetical protein n=1 Tax=Allomesorhizobium alhagi TaxID=475067 RepID=UPI00138A1553|nr:hypothetical protein [Mesorhizobium alhagi]